MSANGRNSGGRTGRNVKSTALKRFLDTTKYDTVVLGDVQRYLLAREPKDRRSDVIHPSEMSKSDWCHRATYYRLAGVPLNRPENPSFTLENVWAEGHDIHSRWQSWLWDMGRLYGSWSCRVCGEVWTGLSPERCPSGCGEKWPKAKRLLEYHEVPVFDDEYLIAGHADGQLDTPDGPLIEVKSIGVGTLRWEAPQLLAKYENDLEQVWRNIRRPFRSHLKQGNLYLHCKQVSQMVFIYEFKPNQQVKEFSIKYNADIVAPLLDACLDIKWALQRGTPPPCPNGGCAECQAYETGSIDAENDTDEEPDAGDGEGFAGGEGEAAAGGVVASPEAEGRGSSPRRRLVRTSRRRVDEPVHEAYAVGRLLERGPDER